MCGERSTTDEAHIEAERIIGWDDTLFDSPTNKIPLCPTCHRVFDAGLFTVSASWRVWIFSDMHAMRYPTGGKVNNPFQPFLYSYPYNDRKFRTIPENRILSNNTHEFNNRHGIAYNIFQKRLENKLKEENMWDLDSDVPKIRRIKRIVTVIEED